MANITASAVVFLIVAGFEDLHQCAVWTLSLIPLHLLLVPVKDFVASVAELDKGLATRPGVLPALHGLVGEVCVAADTGVLEDFLFDRDRTIKKLRVTVR